ncbi:MAG: DUF418 domain-containing protein [Alphaproteobacteria bacterium]|nr:DUF418 domain-containing protein [Alphaproteobacteria bacterium]
MIHAPVAEVERADVLDALRAFALLGIFISHVPGFSGFEFMTAAGQAALDRFGANAWLDAALQFFIDGKFFSLFSLLFGIGFAVQIESAIRAGRNFTRHFSRRLAILFAIGVAHALFWYGDILKDYALIGLLLLATARWTPKSTAVAAAAALLLRAFWPLIVWMLVAQTAPLEAGANPKGDFFALTETFAGTDPAAIFAANLELLRFKALQMLYEGKAISILAMFLLGAYIGKRRLYRDLALHEPLLRTVFAVSAPIGIIGNALLIPIGATTPNYPPSPMWVLQHMVFAVAVPAMTLAYASGFALLWTRRAGKFLRALAPAGRMALTTYVSQSLIGVAVFYGIGLNWHGTLGLADCITFALAVFALQCAASAFWFSLFRFGPLEWLWRRATYGTPLPMLRRTLAVA